MSQTKQERNKALVLEAFDTPFNKRAGAAKEGVDLPDGNELLREHCHHTS